MGKWHYFALAIHQRLVSKRTGIEKKCECISSSHTIFLKYTYDSVQAIMEWLFLNNWPEMQWRGLFFPHPWTTETRATTSDYFCRGDLQDCSKVLEHTFSAKGGLSFWSPVHTPAAHSCETRAHLGQSSLNRSLASTYPSLPPSVLSLVLITASTRT